MRTKNSIKNGVVSVIMSIVALIIGFFSQKVFIYVLGTEYLGLNGLYTNILSILSVAELGFGTAIIYNLYKPVAKNDYKQINILMNYYKKIYRIVACVIFGLGIIMIPFIPMIVGNTTISHLNILFLLSLLEVVFSYLLTYKRSILYATQKNYIVNIIHIFYLFLFNLIEIVLLILTQSYILYLIVKIVCRCLENIAINIYVNRHYSYLQRDLTSLDDTTKKDIKTKVKGLLFHNIGSALVQGTDNIIISNMFGLTVVGLYSNYYMITNSINGLITQLFQSITSSVGSLLIDDNKEKSYSIYKNILFVNSFIYCFVSSCIISTITVFIELWLGADYLLSNFILITLMINFYLQGMKKTNSLFKNAAGVFYEDRYVPILESAINLVASILLGYVFGVAGVFIGTIISSMVLILYSYPIFVYKKLFNRSYFAYLKDNLIYYFTDITLMIISFMVTSQIHLNNLFLTFCVQLILAFIIISAYYLIFYRKRSEFIYFKNIFFDILYSRKKQDITKI